MLIERSATPELNATRLSTEEPRTRGAQTTASNNSLLEDPTASLMASGDVGCVISAMLLQAGRTARAGARESKEAAMALEESASARRLDAMGDAAEARFVGGVAAGGMSFLGGVSQVTAATAPSDLAANANLGAGKLLEASGGLAKAGADLVASGHDAEAERAELQKKQAERGISNASDDDKDARDLLGRAMDHYKEFLLKKEEARKASMVRA